MSALKNKKMLKVSLAIVAIVLGISSYAVIKHFPSGTGLGSTDFFSAYSGSDNFKDGVALSACCSASISAAPKSSGSYELTWSSSTTSGCSASGDWSGSKGTSGTEDVYKPGNGSYTITCSAATHSGDTCSASTSTAGVTCVDPSCSGLCGDQKRHCLINGESCDDTVDCGYASCGPCSSGKWTETKPE